MTIAAHWDIRKPSTITKITSMAERSAHQTKLLYTGIIFKVLETVSIKPRIVYAVDRETDPPNENVYLYEYKLNVVYRQVGNILFQRTVNFCLTTYRHREGSSCHKLRYNFHI